MGKRTMAAPRARYGTKDLILQCLESTRTGAAISTPDLIRSVRGRAGFPMKEITIRSAVRSMIQNGIVSARPNGRKLMLRLTGPVASTPSAAPPTPPSSPAGPLAPAQVLSLPHKLSVGEVLVLHVDESGVETATNVHGRVILERHVRPKL